MNYNGVNCPVCGQPLHENDDIVVCPECGAPHHRDCYKQLGHCALENELHEKGLEWKNPNEKEIARTHPVNDGNASLVCPNCGLLCKGTDSICPNCGSMLPGNDVQGRQVVDNAFPESTGNPEQDKLFGAIYENDSIGGIPAKDFIYVIRQNYTYFLRVFKIFSQRIKAKVFNWSAFFFGYLYFFYRKMYKVGIVLFGIYLLSNVPSLLLTYHMLEQIVADPMVAASLQFNTAGYEGLVMASQLLMYARIGVSIYCGFTANRHYFNHCRDKIQKMQKVCSKTNSNEYYQTLSGIGGTSMAWPIAAIVALMVITFLVGALFTYMLM